MNFLNLNLQERALHYMDAAQGDIEVVEGINLVQTEAQPTGGRSLNDVDLPVDVEEREAEIDSLLVDRVARFLQSHTLQFKVSKDSIQDMQRSLDEGEWHCGIA
jgi:pantothenate kinase